MKKIITFASVLLLPMMMSTSQANGFSYSYIEAGINKYDDIGNGTELNASLAINDRIHFFAGGNSVESRHYDVELDLSITHPTLQIGFLC